MPTENIMDALGLDALTGFSEETWAEFLLGLAQHSSEINRFYGRHEDAPWDTLTVAQIKHWYEWRRRQQFSLGVPGPSADRERGRSKAKIDFLDSFFLVAARDHDELLAESPDLKHWPSYRYCYHCRVLLPGSTVKCEECSLDLAEQPVLYPRGGIDL